MIKKAEELGVKVLYGDTDSVFLLNPSSSQMKEISDWSKKELDLDLEAEKTYQFLALSDRKKNYVGIYKGSGKIDMKGVLAKKRNTPKFIKQVFNEVIEKIRNVTNNDEFLNARASIIEVIKENRNKIGKPDAFKLDDYAINIGITKNLKDYKSTIPQHIRVAKRLKETKGKEYKKGDVIKLIKINGEIGATDIEIEKFQDLDVKKYRELLRSAIEQLLDALGIEFEEIIYKGYKKSTAKPKVAKKLDTFFK